MRRLEVSLPRYGQKRYYAGFEFVFTIFAVLFIEHWRLLYIDWRKGCQETRENVYSPALKLSLQLSKLYF